MGALGSVMQVDALCAQTSLVFPQVTRVIVHTTSWELVADTGVAQGNELARKGVLALCPCFEIA